jgi:phosphoribulokinase
MAGSDLLFYEGLHGAYAADDDRHRRRSTCWSAWCRSSTWNGSRSCTATRTCAAIRQEAVVDTILRRMPDYVNHICPQFSRTHVNFQRVPTVDTSNPFIARDIPTADESMVVIRFANPKGIDFPYLLSMLHGSMMTRPNTIVVPGGKMGLAMQMIFTPMILRLMERKRRA